MLLLTCKRRNLIKYLACGDKEIVRVFIAINKTSFRFQKAGCPNIFPRCNRLFGPTIPGLTSGVRYGKPDKFKQIQFKRKLNFSRLHFPLNREGFLPVFFFLFFICLLFGLWRGRGRKSWLFPGSSQGQGSNRSHGSDNARSFTHWTTQELHFLCLSFLRLTFSMHLLWEHVICFPMLKKYPGGGGGGREAKKALL